MKCVIHNSESVKIDTEYTILCVYCRYSRKY